MYDIDEIIKMLDWNNSIEVQEKGIENKNRQTLQRTIQPVQRKG